jgi:hypothetical protein
MELGPSPAEITSTPAFPSTFIIRIRAAAERAGGAEPPWTAQEAIGQSAGPLCRAEKRDFLAAETLIDE